MREVVGVRVMGAGGEKQAEKEREREEREVKETQTDRQIDGRTDRQSGCPSTMCPVVDGRCPRNRSVERILPRCGAKVKPVTAYHRSWHLEAATCTSWRLQSCGILRLKPRTHSKSPQTLST